MKIKRITLLLLLAAFIVPMGLSEPAFAGKCSYLKQLARQLDEIRDLIADGDAAHAYLLDTLDDIQTQISDEVLHSWSKKLPANKRFKLVLNGKGVLDRETGLVWSRSPSLAQKSWSFSMWDCYKAKIGGRKGWRPPTIEELLSLVDMSQPPPYLPAGHPFTNVQYGAGDFYWSSNTVAHAPTNAYLLQPSSGSVAHGGKGLNNYIWFVRGGQGYDGGH